MSWKLTVKRTTTMILVVGLTLYSLFVGVNSMVVRELFHNDSLDRVTLMTSRLPRTISILLSGATLSISRECYFIFWYLSSIWFRCCSRCILLDAREFFLSRLNELPVNLFLTDFVIFYNYLCSLFLNKGFRSWFSDRIRHFLSNIQINWNYISGSRFSKCLVNSWKYPVYWNSDPESCVLEIWWLFQEDYFSGWCIWDDFLTLCGYISTCPYFPIRVNWWHLDDFPIKKGS